MKTQVKKWLFISLMLFGLFFTNSILAQVGLHNPGITQEQERNQASKGFDYGNKSGSALQQLENISGQKVNVQKSTNQPQQKAKSTTVAPALSFNQQMNVMVTGMVMQGLLNALFSSNTSNNNDAIAQQKAMELAQQQEENRLAQEAMENAKYEAMMQSYKSLEDNQQLGIKSLGTTEVTFKTLDDTQATENDNQTHRSFFGDSMPDDVLNLLTDSYNDPTIVDLRETKAFVDDHVTEDEPKMVQLLRDKNDEAKGEPIIQKPDCIQLKNKLNSLLDQRTKFQSTVNLANSELDTWQKANQNALKNAAKDGVEFFTGQLLEIITKRANAAKRLQMIIDKNKAQMLKEGVDVSIIESKINTLQKWSNAGQINEFTGQMNDWSSFVKNGLSSLISGMSAENEEIQQIMKDPMMEKYFETESPALSALLDISKIASSYGTFGKWVLKKVPIIGLVEISTKQLYNLADWATSYYFILDSHQIKGKVMTTAQYIQKNINDTYAGLADCSR